MNKLIILIFTAILIIFFIRCNETIGNNAPGKLVTQPSVKIYSAPKGADMATGIIITVNGEIVPVYAFPHIRPSASGRFCQFDFSDSVTVEVYPVPSDAEVYPVSANLKPTIKNGKLTVKLTEPVNMFIPYIAWIFANEMEENPPKEGDTGVLYFGPGIASPGTITLGSNQTLYLAGGAYVTAQLRVKDAENFKIMGRGILRTTSGTGITYDNCTNGLLSGIVQLHTPEHGWSGNLKNSKNLRIINFKVVGGKNYSTDGTNLQNSSYVVYDQCAWCVDDDCIAIKGNSRNDPNDSILIQNCVLYSSNGGCVTLGTETIASRYSNITVRNCDMYFDDRYGYPDTGFTTKGPMNICSRYATYFENIVFDNLDIWTNRNVCRFYFALEIYNNIGNMTWPGRIENLSIKNIRVTGPGKMPLMISGYDTDHIVKNIHFSNITLNGQCLNSIEDSHFIINEFTEDITVSDCNYSGK